MVWAMMSDIKRLEMNQDKSYQYIYRIEQNEIKIKEIQQRQYKEK